MSHYKSLCLIFASLLCLLAQVSSQQKVPLPAAVINEMASRETRYHHYLWHNIRDNWNRFSSSTQSQIRNLGWAPPRPSKRYDSKGNAITISDNNSGEDFLYMHRQMIARANEIIASTNDPYGKITGWKKIPVPGDSDWPVSSAYTIPGNSGTTQSVSLRKSRDFYYQNIKPMEDLLTDPSELRKMTLGELGTKLESTVHNWLHIRFSEKSSVGYRPSGSGVIPDFDKKWDNPRYNWLGDTYSSQVHPLFWKIHGWVDDRIEDWRVANKLSSIRWKGTWTGGPMSSLSNVLKSKVTGNGSSLRVPMNMESQRDKEESVDDIMQQVLDILLKTREESNFSDKIVLDFVLPSSSQKPKTNSKTRAPRQSRCKN